MPGTYSPFPDRRAAGEALARELQRYADDEREVIVLGLPRGGVPVAAPVARSLHAPLDVLVVRKVGVPDQPELAMGAVASGQALFVNTEIVRAARVSDRELTAAIQRSREELAAREANFRGDRPSPSLEGKVVIVVDDGIATGSTLKAALQALRTARTARLVVAVPVGPESSCAELRSLADEVVCLLTPTPFHAVGQWYEDFGQTGDEEVREALAVAADRR